VNSLSLSPMEARALPASCHQVFEQLLFLD